jgi:hypothetical protein
MLEKGSETLVGGAGLTEAMIEDEKQWALPNRQDDEKNSGPNYSEELPHNADGRTIPTRRDKGRTYKRIIQKLYHRHGGG